MTIPTPLSMRLLADEKLLWSARPDMAHTHFAVLRVVPGLILFAIAIGLAALGLYGYLKTQEALSLAIILFSMPFFWAAFGVLSAPFSTQKRIGESVYGISNQRVIIANERDGTLFRAILLETVCGIQRWERKDGFAALEIETNGQANQSLVFDIFLLDGLSDPDRVELLLVNLTGVPSTSSKGVVQVSANQAPV
jgi:hypothetical protein